MLVKKPFPHLISLQAIYENMLVELPFASFFLSKILSRHRGDVDIHHLASLDPEMYRSDILILSLPCASEVQLATPQEVKSITDIDAEMILIQL